MEKLSSLKIGKSRNGASSGAASKTSSNLFSQKCSITLYQPDFAILDKVRDFLRRKGVRTLSDSEGIRLACRTIAFDERLLKTYEKMKLEDGRRKK